MYVFKDKSGVVGQVVLQLGCSETALLRSACGQPLQDMSNLPPTEGTTLYRLLTDPDSVRLDNLSLEAIVVCYVVTKTSQAHYNCYVLISEMHKVY